MNSQRASRLKYATVAGHQLVTTLDATWMLTVELNQPVYNIYEKQTYVDTLHRFKVVSISDLNAFVDRWRSALGTLAPLFCCVGPTAAKPDSNEIQREKHKRGACERTRVPAAVLYFAVAKSIANCRYGRWSAGPRACIVNVFAWVEMKVNV